VKVVIFCGGLGMRLREYSESIPKPMVTVGYRPILWHVMRYYAHFGHKDFILCLGYKGDSIKKYFLEYDETVSNDFVFSEGGKKVDLLASDIHDWKITFVDTGLTANIGMRLKAVQPYLLGEEMFLANYSDGVADLPLPAMIDFMKKRPQSVACFVGVAPYATYHLVTLKDDGIVQSIRHVKDCGMRINGGYFVLRPEIFDWMRPGEELVQEPFNAWPPLPSSSPTPMTGSGPAWILSRTNSSSRISTHATRYLGRFGRARLRLRVTKLPT